MINCNYKYITNNITKISYNCWILLLWIGLLFVHVLMSAFMTGPIIVADETGYLSNARVIIGQISSSFYDDLFVKYPWGYSLVISPALLLSNDPIIQYHLVLLINAFLMSLVFPICLIILKKFWNSNLDCILGSLTISIYPAVLLYSNVAFSENLFIFLQVLSLYFLLESLKQKSFIWPFLFGIVCTYSYFVRVNGISTLIASIIIIILAYLTNKISTNGLKSFSLGILFTVVLGNIIEVVFFGSCYGEVYQGNISIGSLLQKITYLEGIFAFIREIIGQVFYLSLATLLSIIILFIYLVELIINNIKERKLMEEVYIFSFVAIAFLGTLLISSLFMTMQERGDHLLYGRYNEGYIVNLLVLGIYAISRTVKSRFFTIHLVTSIIVLVVCLIFTGPYEGKLISTINIMMFHSVITAISESRIVILSIFGCIGITFLILFKYNSRLSILIMAIVFCISSAYTYSSYFIHSAKGRAQEREIVKYIIENELQPRKIYYDRLTFSSFHFHTYRYYLPNAIFNRFRSDQNIRIDASLIISGRKDLNKIYNGARLASLENHHNQALWVLPGKLQDELEKKHMLFSEGYSGILPEQAFKSELEILNLKRNEKLVLKPGEKRELEIKLTNKSLHPWPNLFGWKNSDGAVRIGWKWKSKESSVTLMEGRKELPYTIYPGQTINMQACIDTKDPNETQLKPGEYEVHLGLVQDGVTWFYEQGDVKVVIPVEITQY